MNTEKCKALGREAEVLVRDRFLAIGVEAELTPEKHPFDVLAPGLAIEVKSVNGARRFSIGRRAYARKRAWARENGRCPIIAVVHRASGEIRMAYLANCDWEDLVPV